MQPFQTPTRRDSRWSLIGFFVLLLFLLPSVITVAQDYDAVINRIKQAVDAKEISSDQARKMIATLKTPSAKQATTEKGTSTPKVNWNEIEKKIEGAVKAGKITRKQADAKYEQLKKQPPQKPTAKKVASDSKVNWDAIEKNIEGAVKAGKITRKQADAKYEQLKKQSPQKPPAQKHTGKPKALPTKPAAKKKPQ